jgi:hypothetical protein
MAFDGTSCKRDYSYGRPQKMISAEKLCPIRNYLETNFPEFTVTDFFNSDSMLYVFYLEEESKMVSIRGEFLGNRSISEIQIFLEKSKIADFLKNVKPVSIAVDEDGNITVAKQYISRNPL